MICQVSEEHHLQIQPKREKYISDSDNLILEDTLQRISLCGNINAHQMYTGTVIALAGKEESAGHFKVEEYVFVGLSPQRPLPNITQDR